MRYAALTNVSCVIFARRGKVPERRAGGEQTIGKHLYAARSVARSFFGREKDGLYFIPLKDGVISFW